MTVEFIATFTKLRPQRAERGSNESISELQKTVSSPTDTNRMLRKD